MARTETNKLADDRIKRPDANSRPDRENLDRTDEAFDERLYEGIDLSASWDQTLLPQPPKIPGFRCIYLSTTNNQDSIPFRMKLGYRPVEQKDLSESDKLTWASLVQKTGEYSGMFAVNEMILFKLPEVLYQRYMREMHHDKPNAEEAMLKSGFETMMNGDLDNGRQLVREVGDGVERLGQGQKRTPTF